MTTHDCQPKPVAAGRFQVVACDDCGTVSWFEEGQPVDPDVALAHLFGDFDLVGCLPGLGAPAPEVLVYRPPRLRRRRALGTFAPHHWYRVSPRLWLSHDTEVLLLAPTDPTMVRNLTRGA